MRPDTIDGFTGHAHAAGQNGVIRKSVEQDRLFSMILWGPPGCGKTTLAVILARSSQSCFIRFSAVLSGIKEIRAAIKQAENQQVLGQKTLLFVDEIHRFNKSQQDAFLHHVESGLITLIGATTENPSFEVIAPLLSRCRVIRLNSLTDEDVGCLIDRALGDAEKGLGQKNLTIDTNARTHLIRTAGGDARFALNGLEIAADLTAGKLIRIQDIEKAVQHRALTHDKSGEDHFNLISAFHKSMRGSDPDAALYWLARMIMAGEDPLYAARRMVRFASEDIGNADPAALSVAIHAMETFRFLGAPEGELALAQAAVYLATAPKSNRIYMAWNQVKEVIENTGYLPVPMHIRNAPTRLMASSGYGKGYVYPHDNKDAYVPQEYLPEQLGQESYYFPANRGYEKIIKQRMEKWQNLKLSKK